MATIIPNINAKSTNMTSGERRFGRRLEAFLEDDYSCWFDVPVGNKRRYPDFIILHPRRGILLLEIKDWRLDSVQSINHNSVELRTNSGVVFCPNPIEQARQCAYQVVNRLKRDPALVQMLGKHKGQLVCPYGYGAVFTNINRKQWQNALGDTGSEVMPEHLIICQDEMQENTDPEVFQKRLWDMFNYSFAHTLTLPQIDRIRAHLFPEIRIDVGQVDLFADDGEEPQNLPPIPDIIRVMDMQQELLARSFGEGHRVVHGVAGSGKTLILGYRCWYLAQTQSKPILVLCYNISLASKLRAYMRERSIEQQVQVYHFHDWCGQQLRTYHVNTLVGTAPLWERQVLSVIDGVSRGMIPKEQYGAVLIDEGHDFEAQWLQLIVQMIDSATNSLLLLFDDAQAIYRKKTTLDFTLSSVGIQARGRTTILKLNYRNTREILEFAFEFAKEYLQPKDADEDKIPLVRPEMAGNSGPRPVFKYLNNTNQELHFICSCLIKWHSEGVPWKHIAVIYCSNTFSEKLQQACAQSNIPHYWMGSSSNRKNYNAQKDEVLLVSRQSSKGLEFPRVVVAGIGSLRRSKDVCAEEARLLYVAMTRAQETLMLTAASSNSFTERLHNIGNNDIC